MIFPNVRISELRLDVEEKRERFQASRDRFKELLKEKVSPLTFLREHPKLIFGMLLSAASATKTMKRLLGRPLGKKSGLGRFLKIGWLLKFAGVGSKLMGKAVLPVGLAAVRMALRTATRALRSSRA